MYRQNNQNNDRLLVAKYLAIFMTAFAARIAYLLPQIGAKSYAGADTVLYLDIARNILNGNGFAAGQSLFFRSFSVPCSPTGISELSPQNR
jgi:hypothetical protein